MPTALFLSTLLLSIVASAAFPDVAEKLLARRDVTIKTCQKAEDKLKTLQAQTGSKKRSKANVKKDIDQLIALVHNTSQTPAGAEAAIQAFADLKSPTKKDISNYISISVGLLDGGCPTFQLHAFQTLMNSAAELGDAKYTAKVKRALLAWINQSKGPSTHILGSLIQIALLNEAMEEKILDLSPEAKKEHEEIQQHARSVKSEIMKNMSELISGPMATVARTSLSAAEEEKLANDTQFDPIKLQKALIDEKSEAKKIHASTKAWLAKFVSK